MDIEVLIEAYRVFKEYIPSKDRQAAADHFIGMISDYGLSDSDFKQLAECDSYTKHAAEDYFGDEFDEDDDEDEY